jgi:hypothetical protein
MAHESRFVCHDSGSIQHFFFRKLYRSSKMTQFPRQSRPIKDVRVQAVDSRNRGHGTPGSLSAKYREFQYYDTLWQISPFPTNPGFAPL